MMTGDAESPGYYAQLVKGWGFPHNANPPIFEDLGELVAACAASIKLGAALRASIYNARNKTWVMDVTRPDQTLTAVNEETA